jgi:hypothetical protein
MDDKVLKFYLIFMALVVAFTYFVTEYVVGYLGTFAFILPGIFAVMGFWLAKKFTGQKQA